MSERDLSAPEELDEHPSVAEPDRDIETPEVDAAERLADVEGAERAGDDRLPEHIPFDVDEADATEQRRVVGGDDDEDHR